MPGPVRTETALSFDIFCRVIDNYGDIGVCWRLARQLTRPPFSYPVRLWVDDLERFRRLESSIDPLLPQQQHSGIDIVHWGSEIPALTPHTVVIEAFACTPPPSFVDAMVTHDSLWLNLEYLSAEAWVEGFHLQPSIQANGLRKYFFFPGFTSQTGGLLREWELIEVRRDWQSTPEARTPLLQYCGLSDDDIEDVNAGARLILLFCYPEAPVVALIEALAASSQPSVVLVPEGIQLPTASVNPSSTAATINSPNDTSDAETHVRLRRIPFVDQDRFDRLLWSSDLNIVRGEDSLVRALWAARPMIWQPYRQDDDLHLTKLDAWLARSPLHAEVRSMMHSWSESDALRFNELFSDCQQPANWARWVAQSRQWSDQLAAQPDLASALVQFCTQARRTG